MTNILTYILLSIGLILCGEYVKDNHIRTTIKIEITSQAELVEECRPVLYHGMDAVLRCVVPEMKDQEVIVDPPWHPNSIRQCRLSRNQPQYSARYLGNNLSFK